MAEQQAYLLREACFCFQEGDLASSALKLWQPACSPHPPPVSAQLAALATPWRLAAAQLSGPAALSSPWLGCACSCCLEAAPACLVPFHEALQVTRKSQKCCSSQAHLESSGCLASSRMALPVMRGRQTVHSQLRCKYDMRC